MLTTGELHTSTVGESSVKCYPVKAMRQRDETLLHDGKRRHCVACLLSCAADASEMLWSKFVVVIQKGESGSEIRELSHRTGRETASQKSGKGGKG